MVEQRLGLRKGTNGWQATFFKYLSASLRNLLSCVAFALHTNDFWEHFVASFANQGTDFREGDGIAEFCQGINPGFRMSIIAVNQCPINIKDDTLYVCHNF